MLATRPELVASPGGATTLTVMAALFYANGAGYIVLPAALYARPSRWPFPAPVTGHRSPLRRRRLRAERTLPARCHARRGRAGVRSRRRSTGRLPP
jgi:hypothetical protein